MKPNNNSFNFKIGADPEFTIASQGSPISAIGFLKMLFKKTGDMGIKLPGVGVLGWDGAAATGELRPLPSTCPATVTKRIGHLFKTLAEKANFVDIISSSAFASTGGHIHLELPPALQEGQSDSRKKVDDLFKKLAALALPLTLGEDPDDRDVRRKRGYGNLEDYRVFEHQTIEFRSPTAEWLTTPKICQATLAYMGVCWDQLLNHPETHKKYKTLFFRSKKQIEDMEHITGSGYELFINYLLKNLRRAIKTFALYPTFKEECDYILNPQKVLADKQKAQFNIAIGWNLINKHCPTQRQLLSDKQIRERLTEKYSESALQELTHLISVSCGDELNVDQFALELKKRILAYNWKPRFNYYLFGIKEGVKDHVVISPSATVLAGAEQTKSQEDKDWLSLLSRKIASRLLLKEGASKYFPDNKITLGVGIPYAYRMALNTKPFIEKIIELEKKQKLDSSDQTATTQEPASVDDSSEAVERLWNTATSDLSFYRWWNQNYSHNLALADAPRAVVATIYQNWMETEDHEERNRQENEESN